MKSPWKSMNPLEADREYVVLASSIPPLSRSSTGKWFRGAMAVRKQLSGTDGVLGFSLLAQPWRKHYATLSVWENEAALAAFVAAHPHTELMGQLKAEMGQARFVRWTLKGSEGNPSWNDALRRLSS